MKIAPIDPRDERWEEVAPGYRVYFWSSSGSSDEFHVSEADVPEILAWAEAEAVSSVRTYSLLLEVHDSSTGLGLVRLCGWDPNTGELPLGSDRPLHASARPPSTFHSPEPLHHGLSATGVDVLEDRVVIRTLSLRTETRDHRAHLFSWRVTDDVGTEYRFLAGGAGGGEDLVSYGAFAYSPRPPSTATRLFVSSDDPDTATRELRLPGFAEASYSYGARRWLRDLALDVIEHDNCNGCRVNAAQALDETGQLDLIAERGLPDPRKESRPTHGRRARKGGTAP